METHLSFRSSTSAVACVTLFHYQGFRISWSAKVLFFEIDPGCYKVLDLQNKVVCTERNLKVLMASFFPQKNVKFTDFAEEGTVPHKLIGHTPARLEDSRDSP